MFPFPSALTPTGLHDVDGSLSTNPSQIWRDPRSPELNFENTAYLTSYLVLI